VRGKDELVQTRVTLLNRLKDWRDERGWQEFFDAYWKLIYGVSRKAGLTDAEAMDVVQETLLAVAKHMPSFKYNPVVGSFKAWLLQMTRWRILDQFRKRRPVFKRRTGTTTTGRTATIEKIPDENSLGVEEIWQANWEKNLFDAALLNVKRRIDPQKFQIFDFYVNKEWPPEKVAQSFGVSVNTVYLAKNRISELLRDEVQRLEREVT
jgi:RNA polymerase sigma factor (sigma-70 family)